MKRTWKIAMMTVFMASAMALPTVSAAPLTTATTAPTVATAKANESMTLFQQLQGKTLDLNYASGDHYYVSILSENQLRWKSIGVSDGGPSEETEDYTVKEIATNVYFVSWMEQSGMTVSEVIDLPNQKVYATITWGDETKANGRDSVSIEGTATILP